jgi:hypothetical protein
MYLALKISIRIPRHRKNGVARASDPINTILDRMKPAASPTVSTVGDKAGLLYWL